MATDTLKIGSTMPGFEDLPGVDGKKHSLRDFEGKKGFVVVFSCNHCPTVQAYEDRMIAFQKEYGPKGFQLIAINSNETENYPEDSYDEMVKRARKLGLRYHGKMDDNKEHSAARINYVRDAANAILAGKEVKETETYSIGCTIKWK
jgi:thiol-disulfide isomerase/thioredoxin